MSQPKSTSPLDQNRRQFFDAVIGEAEQQPHPIPKRLEQAMLIGAGEQQGEVGERKALRRSARLAPAGEDDPPFVEGEVQGRLEFGLQLVGLVDEHDRAGVAASSTPLRSDGCLMLWPSTSK